MLIRVKQVKLDFSETKSRFIHNNCDLIHEPVCDMSELRFDILFDTETDG
jgi:hypothetical protein